MSKKITLYDIADKLKISTSTISRVLNNSSLISDEKSQLILKTAREMGYEKRTIRRPGSRTILNIILYIPHLSESQYQMFYDSVELIYGIKSGFHDTKINIISELNDGSSLALKNRKLGDIDGAVFAFTDPAPSVIETLNRREIPFLLLNRNNRELNYISHNHSEAMSVLFELQMKQQKKIKPLYLGFGEAKKVNSYRKNAFLHCCKKKSIENFDLMEVQSFKEINDQLLDFIQKGCFSWIVCFNDIFAVSLISAALARGLSVPEDFSVTGFDNSPVRNIFPLKVDTIDLEVQKMGKNAGNWLYNQIIEKQNEPIQMELDVIHIKGNTIRRRR